MTNSIWATELSSSLSTHLPYCPSFFSSFHSFHTNCNRVTIFILNLNVFTFEFYPFLNVWQQGLELFSVKSIDHMITTNSGRSCGKHFKRQQSIRKFDLDTSNDVLRDANWIKQYFLNTIDGRPILVSPAWVEP